MNYIFLDIDGVLNSVDFFIRCYKVKRKTSIAPIDEEAVKFLATICRENSAKVVLSSTWRFSFTQDGRPKDDRGRILLEYFNKYNIELAGRLSLTHEPRGALIYKYIYTYCKTTDRFIVIDDDSFDIDPYIASARCIFTSTQKGLQEKHIALARTKLAV